MGLIDKKAKIFLGVVLLLGIFIVITNNRDFKELKNSSSNPTISNPQTQTNPCEDMDSYNKGLQYGRLQRGGLPDCDTYYYEGAANNKDCWCQGFMEGRK